MLERLSLIVFTTTKNTHTNVANQTQDTPFNTWDLTILITSLATGGIKPKLTQKLNLWSHEKLTYFPLHLIGKIEQFLFAKIRVFQGKCKTNLSTLTSVK